MPLSDVMFRAAQCCTLLNLRTTTPWYIVLSLLQPLAVLQPVANYAIASKQSLSSSVECLSDESVIPIPTSSTSRRSNLCLLEPDASQPVAVHENFPLVELQNIPCVCQIRKAPGLGGVTNQALQNLTSDMLPPLLADFNTMWQSGAVPID